jgi:uncharacterized protein
MYTTAIPLSSVKHQLYPERFDSSRVRHLPRKGADLLMDRLSGGWFMLAPQDRDLLPLLERPQAEIAHPSFEQRLTQLRSALKEQYIGYPKPKVSHDNLNTVILKLTNACNLACTYCYDHEHMEDATVLPMAHIETTLSQALDLVDSKLWIILHGGEPTLLWPTIEKIVHTGKKLAAERNKIIEFTGQTNLTRVTQRMVDFSTEHGIDWGVSLDGAAAINDKFRIRHNGKGSFDAFEQALAQFPEFVKRCGVMTTVTSANANKLYDTAKYFHALGMPSWDWSLFQPIGRARHAEGLAPKDDVILHSWRAIFQAVERGDYDGFPVKPVTKYLDNFLHGSGANMCMRDECGAARDLLSISASGTIEACDCIDPLGALSGLGHIAHQSLSDARNSDIAKTIRSRNMSEHSLCSNCIWYGVCGGTCLAHAQAVDDVWDVGCAVAQQAFGLISDSLSHSDRLLTYKNSLR